MGTFGKRLKCIGSTITVLAGEAFTRVESTDFLAAVDASARRSTKSR